MRLHPGLLVRRLHLDREEVSAAGPSSRTKTGAGNLLHAAPAQARLRHPQPGGHRVSGDEAGEAEGDMFLMKSVLQQQCGLI